MGSYHGKIMERNCSTWAAGFGLDYISTYKNVDRREKFRNNKTDALEW